MNINSPPPLLPPTMNTNSELKKGVMEMGFFRVADRGANGGPSRVSVIFADQNPYRFWPSFVPLMDIPKGFTSKMTLEVA